MRFSAATAFLLSGGALAMSRLECFSQNSIDVAELATCGHRASLAYCLGHLPGGSISEVEGCYSNAGCTSEDAIAQAKEADRVCQEMAKIGELRKRYRASTPEPTPAGYLMMRSANIDMRSPNLIFRDVGAQCLSTTSVKTTVCDVSTVDNKAKTGSCSETQVAKSVCAPGLLCSIDSSGTDICFEEHNNLGIGGIIIAILFGVCIVLGVSALTFMSCREGRNQKRLEARAEATALARAATKKQRSQEARAPLMRQERGLGGGTNDPFHDRNQS